MSEAITPVFSEPVIVPGAEAPAEKVTPVFNQAVLPPVPREPSNPNIGKELVDAAKFLGTTAVRAGAGIAGLYGDLGELAGAAGEWTGRKIGQGLTGMTDEGYAAKRRETPPAFLANIGPARFMPTSHGIENTVFGLTGGPYTPGTGLGRVAMGSLEMAGEMAGPQAVPRLVREATHYAPKVGALGMTAAGELFDKARIARDATMGAFGGAAGGAAAEASDNNPWYTVGATLLGSLVPGGARTLKKAYDIHTKPGEMAEEGAARLFRGAAEDPNAALRGLEGSTGTSYNTVLGANDRGLTQAALHVKPDALSGENTGIRAVKQAVTLEPSPRPPGMGEGTDAQIALRGQGQAQLAGAQHSAADTTQAATDAVTPTVNPNHADASARVRAISDAVYDTDRQASKALWNAPELAGALIEHQPAVSSLYAAINNLPATFRGTARAEVDKLADALRDQYGRIQSVPLDELQSQRSAWLEQSRAARRAGDAQAEAIYGKLAEAARETIENGVIMDPSGKALAGAHQALSDARSATKAFHEKHNAGYMGKLDDVGSQGERRLLETTTLNGIIKPEKAGGRELFDRLLEKTTPAGGVPVGTAHPVAGPVSDYLMAELKQIGGNNPPSSKQIEAFAKKYEHILNHPAMDGLGAKVEDIRRATLNQEALVAPIAGVFKAADPVAEATKLMHSTQGDPQKLWGVRYAMLAHMDSAASTPQSFVSFYANNKAVVDRVLGGPQNPQGQAILDHIADFSRGQVHKGAEKVGSVEGSTLLDALLGARTGAVLQGGIGFMAGKAAGAATGLSPLYAMELLGAGLGISGRKLLAKAVIGDDVKAAADAALARAFADPEYAKLLLRKATPTAWDDMRKQGIFMRSTAEIANGEGEE